MITQDESMKGKTVLITGATSGIGKATARGLARRGATVVLVGRDREKAERVVSEIAAETGSRQLDFLLCDLTSIESVRKLASDFKAKYERLDVLINNAGAIVGERRMTVDGFEYTFALNHLSHFLLTMLLLDMLKASAPSRIITVSSGAEGYGHIDFEDLMGAREYRAGKAYNQSKLANVLFTYELARRLDGTTVTSNCLHPGVVRTNFGRDLRGLWKALLVISRPFLMSAEKGAETSIYLASSPEVEGISGKYFVRKREARSSQESCDGSVARRLWATSLELTGA